MRESIHQILALKISLISVENALVNYTRFLLLILRLHQIILYGLGKIFLNILKILTINDQIRGENYDSPSREAFEKLIKTIEDQGQKQIKAIQDQEQVKEIKKYTYDAEHTALISRQKEVFNERLERLEKITDLDKIVNSNDLNTADAKFDKFDTALDTMDKIKYGEVSLADAKKIINRN